jgi:hypothetical protein
MWVEVTSTWPEKLPQDGGDVLHDAEKRIENVNTNTPPSFEFKNGIERYRMWAEELFTYMSNLRQHISACAEYVREHQWVLEAVNTKKAPSPVVEVANDNYPPKVQKAA